MDNDGSMLTTRKFSDQSGLPVSTITKLIREGKLEARKRAGKWMIPDIQLQSPVIKGGSNDPVAFAGSHPQTEPAQPVPDPYEPSYSVREFSQRTYLTEFGVLDWLKKGKLHGRREADGSWRVSASDLALPGLKHLLRK